MISSIHTKQYIKRVTASAGFTLIELMVVVAIIGILSAVMFTAMTMTSRSIQISEAKISTQDNGRVAMMIIVRELRQANAATIVAEVDGSLTYRIVQDRDGNGWPVDASGLPEYSPFRNIGLDVDDVNNDGKTTSQLIRTEAGSPPMVMANFVAPIDGITFEPSGDIGVRIVINLQETSGPNDSGYTLSTSVTETVTPRN